MTNEGAVIGIIGALSCALAVLLIVRKDTRKRYRTQSWLLLLAGLCCSGLFGRYRDRVAHTIATASADQTAAWFGVGITYLFGLIIVVWWALDMDFDGLWHQVRSRTSAGARGRGAGAIALAEGGGGRGGRIRVNKHRCRWYTPVLAVLVMPSVALCPWFAAAPDGLRHGLVRGVVALGAHVRHVKGW